MDPSRVPISQAPDNRRLDVWLIEDNAADAFIVERVLQTAQFAADIQIVRDGENALRFVEESKSKPCVVLLDLNLPKISGFAILAALRRRWIDVPVLIVTCVERPVFPDDVLGRDGIGYFRKPFTLEEYLELPKLMALLM